VSAFLLKDCNPNESLADQSLRAAFARFTGADDIASASDSREVACTPYCCYCGNGDDGSGGRRELLKLPLHSDSVHIPAMFITHNFLIVIVMFSPLCAVCVAVCRGEGGERGAAQSGAEKFPDSE
jgi:hypothetical protein